MNKSLLIGVVVLVVILAAIVIVSQLTHPGGNSAPVTALQSHQRSGQGSNNPAGGASAVASPAVNSQAGQEAASQISGLLKAWYKSNAGSYADFLKNANNQKSMRQIFGSLGVALDFYIYSTKSHYVVRTHVSNDTNSYCADDSSATVGQTVAGTDQSFRAQTNCSGVAL